jgi:hypothetical protein
MVHLYLCHRKVFVFLTKLLLNKVVQNGARVAVEVQVMNFMLIFAVLYACLGSNSVSIPAEITTVKEVLYLILLLIVIYGSSPHG